MCTITIALKNLKRELSIPIPMTVRGNKVLYIYGNINLNTAPMLQAYLHAHESILLGTRTDPIINIFCSFFIVGRISVPSSS